MYQKNKWASNFVVYLITISSLFVLLALTLNKVATSHINFSLNFNLFSLFSFSSVLIDICIIYLVKIKKRYSATTNWFLLFLGGATLNAITEGLQRSSIHPQAALFWQNFSFLGLALMPLAFYLFIVSYSAQYKKQFILSSSALILVWGTVVFFAGNGLFFLHNIAQIQHAPWGYYTMVTKGEYIAAFWFSLFYILGTGLLLQLRKTTQNKLIKKQATIFILAFLIPFLAAVLTNLVLPKIIPNVIPPLATIVGAFSGLAVYYGIRQYHLFELDPQVLAQNILDTISEAVIITRLDMSIEAINPEAERILGINSQNVKNQSLQTFFSDDTWRLILEKIANKPEQKTDQLISKSQVRSSNGNFTPVRIAVSSLVDAGDKMANILVLSDITELNKSFDELQNSANQIYRQNEELKKLEAQLREEKNSVEHVVEVRTKELVDAQNKLKAADQLKTEFIMLTSHNLRTPLTIAKGYAEMLTQYPIPDKEKSLIEGLNNGLKKLGELVENLLTISSIESGDQLILDEVSFNQIIEPLVQEASDLALTRNDKFIVNLNSGDLKIKANTIRLQGALRNLLNNACKFTENGTIELNTTKSENKLIITISDTGIGIEQSELPKLFTKFHRATNALNSGYEGEGIGLYLTKLIIDEHGGKINVSSQLQKGTFFSVELPYI